MERAGRTLQGQPMWLWGGGGGLDYFEKKMILQHPWAKKKMNMLDKFQKAGLPKEWDINKLFAQKLKKVAKKYMVNFTIHSLLIFLFLGTLPIPQFFI